jgi:beta-glucosidase
VAPLPASRALGAQDDGRRGAFPENFLWGAGTSAYQVEGAATEGGRGASIWDVFSHRPGTIANGDTGDVADDHFHRFAEDVALMRELGLKAYRFSISWPRVFPGGTGQPNPGGLDFYQRLLDKLLEAQIEPFCTLFHWDLPQKLQERGGWENADTARAFADYAGYVASQLSDKIKYFATLNEIKTFIDLGYQEGKFAPGLTLSRGRVAQARHHALLAHGLGVQALRSHARREIKVGLAENPTAATPATDSAEDIAAAKNAFREENASILTAIMEGAYRPSYLAGLGPDAPRIGPEDMKIIASPVDFVGLNIYQPTYVRADISEKGYALVEPSASFPRMQSKWLYVGPEVLYWAPVFSSQLWNVQNIYITENGASCADAPDKDGNVYDTDRVMFMRNYLENLKRAIDKGAPVKGYFAWSLLDNFEWESGYTLRFGLVYVDFATQKRSMKLSAHYYKDLIRRNGAS